MSKLGTRWGWLSGIVIGGMYIWSAHCASAQITPDATLPNNSIVTPSGNIINITDGTQAGGNLFHSFKDFSVPIGREAFFNNTVDIANIISRVTGGSISNIDGLIRANGIANLFLINPNGIVFGPNARLNIGGSFIGSTASSLKFADGTEFSATNPSATPLLTISVPLGLQFGSNPEKIQVRGPGHEFSYQENIIKYNSDDNANQPYPVLNSSQPGLQVSEGKTLALVGGNVSIESGILKSPAGRIEIGSVGSNQAVSLVPIEQGWKLGYEGTTSFADIGLTEKSFLGATGDGGGAIAITGRNINFSSESIVRADTLGNRNGQQISILGDAIDVDRSNIAANSFNSGNGGQIKLEANNIKLNNNGTAQTQATASGSAGDITVIAKNDFVASNQSGLGSKTFGTGNGGAINIKANSFDLTSESGLASYNYGAGNGGKINIDANSFRLTNVGISSTTGKDSTGNGGEININVAGSFTLNNSNIDVGSSGTGNAGTISITAKNMQIENGILQSNTDNFSKAGNISIRATDSFKVTDAGVQANSSGTGDAGTIRIDAKNVQVERGGIDSIASNSGKSGNISITTDSFSLSDGGITAKSEGIGDAGTISFKVGGSFVLNKPNINLNSSRTGNPGTITIDANNVQISGGIINSDTNNSGKSGNISIRATDYFQVNGAGITANSSGTGDAGTIRIDANKVQISDGGIDSIASNSGKSGNISITTDSFSLSDGGITAKSEGIGDAGTISITAKNAQIESAEVSSSTQNTGKAGEINFNVADSFDIKSVSINTNTTGVANGGKIYISAKKLQIQGSSIRSDASNIGRGGDIELQIGNLLLLRGQNDKSSVISTTATGSGDGGNITINAPNGFIVTVPNENRDITANASTGGGGKITITSLSNFGIQQRSREDFIRLLGTTEPNQLKPENSPTNDITAFSQINPTLQGQVTINTPNFDPSKGFVELPTLLAEISNVIDTSCAAFAEGEGSKFTVTGRGGLPPSPYEPLSTDVIWTDTRTSGITTQQQAKQEPAGLPQSLPEAIKIVPATGWVFNGKGQVTLISHASKANAMGIPPASCPKR